MNVNLKIAMTHLLSKKKQTLVAMMGVTFGIAMFIFMVSFMTGVNDFLEETMLSNTPHIRIYRDLQINRKNIIDNTYPENYLKVVHNQKPKDEKQNLRNATQMLDAIRRTEGVLDASPLLTTQVFYNYGPHQINGSIAGVEILSEDKLFDLQPKMKEGDIRELIGANRSIIMGSGLAKKLNIHKGDKVKITAPNGQQMLLQVVGILQMGIAQLDNVRSYANLTTVQTILQKDNHYLTDINIKLKDLNQSKEVAKRFQQLFGYKAEDWETANSTILLSFSLRNFITIAVVVTLLTVAGFGIYNIMNMTIYNKMKDIAILKATGFSGGDVLSVFLIQAITIGTIGGLIGLLIGFLMAFGISKVPYDGGDFLAIDHLPINFKPVTYITGLVFGMLTTALAGYLPSRKASGIDPVQILRG
jgi:lipoprotein-releasing system permease protein